MKYQSIYESERFAEAIISLSEEKILFGKGIIPAFVHLSVEDDTAQLCFRRENYLECSWRLKADDETNGRILEEFYKKTNPKLYHLIDLFPKEELDTLTPWAKKRLDKSYEAMTMLEGHIDFDKIWIRFDALSRETRFYSEQEEFFTVGDRIIVPPISQHFDSELMK